MEDDSVSNFSAKKKLADRVGHLLFVAAQAAQTLATEALEPLGLPARAWPVLTKLVERGPLTQIELATETAIDRTAMVYLLDELEQQAIVERVRNRQDRRSFLIHLTARGRHMQQHAAARLVDQADVLLAPLDANERRQLVGLLTQVVDHWNQSTTVAMARET